MSDFDEQDHVHLTGDGEDEYTEPEVSDDGGDVISDDNDSSPVTSDSEVSDSLDGVSSTGVSSDTESEPEVSKARRKRQGRDDRAKLKQLRRDPSVRRLLDIMYEDDVNDRSRRSREHSRPRGASRSRYRSKTPNKRGRDRYNRRLYDSESRSRSRSRSKVHSSRRQPRSTSKSRGSKTRNSRTRSKTRSKSKGNKRSNKTSINLKSPSDVTLYTPALRRDQTVAVSPTLANLGRIRNFGSSNVPPVAPQYNHSVIEQISNLVEQIKVRDTEGDRNRSNRESAERRRRDGSVRDGDNAEGEERHAAALDEGRRLADNFILEAEQFKATVQPPKGTSEHLDKLGDFIKSLTDNQDDDFFHLTCHIDQTLRKRIEAGEFVDLDRLLPKTRTQILNDDQRVQQYVDKDGGTYWGPPEKESRITNVRRWEQAFRVYAAIYTTANPGRSAEIWQYVYIINTAAASYAWENVYYDDFTFRQLMAEKPARSWAKTYTQLWNLAMCDPLPKQNFKFSNQDSSAGGDKRTPGWKKRCCWRYNKGNKCHKWNCKWDHRCSSCGDFNHCYSNCSKRSGGNPGNSGGRGRQHSRSRSRTPRKQYSRTKKH